MAQCSSPSTHSSGDKSSWGYRQAFKQDRITGKENKEDAVAQKKTQGEERKVRKQAVCSPQGFVWLLLILAFVILY